MSKKILTVDDSKAVRMIVARALKSYDCEILEAANGEEGLAMASKHLPDVIILDLTMPVLDGIGMLTKMKDSPELKTIPVMMLTAEAGKENVMRIISLGVRDYLIKPFEDEALVKKVKKISDIQVKAVVPQRKAASDPLKFLVVDDKPAIVEQIQAAFAGTPWTTVGLPKTSEALDACIRQVPDGVLINLLLPDSQAYTFLQALQKNSAIKGIPVFGMCVKTATEEQARAQKAGFAGIVTKPIEADNLQGQIVKVLKLDTTNRFFQQRDNVIVVALPGQTCRTASTVIAKGLKTEIAQAVDSGITRLVVDFGQVTALDLDLLGLCGEIKQECNTFSIKMGYLGTEAVRQQLKGFVESKDWAVQLTWPEVLVALDKAA